MLQSCWRIWPDRGFLVNPDPLSHLSESEDTGLVLGTSSVLQIEQIAADMPHLLQARQLRKTLEALPVLDLSLLTKSMNDIDYRIIERAMLLYSYFANAYVHATHEEIAHNIPKGVAVPLYQLACIVERPPILAYSSYVLNNWRRLDQRGPIELDNITVLQNFLGGKDEIWFILVHVAIEARASQVLQGIQKAGNAVAQDEPQMLEVALQDMAQGIAAMITTFHRMPEGCDPDVYYYRVRPYIFSFTDVVYEGVEEFGGKPRSFRGQTGAQSSIVPAIVAAMGIEHEQTDLTRHLDIMKEHMPKPHREFIARVAASTVRAYVMGSGKTTLKDAYNQCLMQLLEFRRVHLYYATTYIFNKVDSPVGTGGTIYMPWLSQLYKETKSQLI